MTSMCSETKCAQRELPPELVDRIIDFLYDEPRALAACSLAARSWTATSRYHRFSTVRLISREDWAKFDHLIEISPTMIRYMRNVTIDVTGVHSARWFPLCTSFTSLEHITMFGAIIPPWQPQALALSNVAPKITSFALDVALVSRYDFWPVIRMFPNLVSLRPVEARYGTELRLVWSSSLPCYSPPISSISVITAGEGHVLDDLCNPPYPLTSLSALDIRDVSHERRSGLQALVETYAGQITQLRLHVQTHSDRYSPNYISHFTNLRHLTLAELRPTRDRSGRSFAWVQGVIVALQSPITHLTIETLVRQPTDLDTINWKAIDVHLSTREVFRSLVRVSVVFLDRLEDEGRDPKSTAHPVMLRRLMPLTSMMGLLTIATRGPKFHPSR